jgi:hypothetical protein
MKRIRLLVLAGAVAVALPFGLSTAGASGSSGSTNSVTIREHAQYDFNGTYIHVGLTVRCSAASTPLPTVYVFVHQPYPETPVPTGADGAGFTNVVCDGKSRSYAVTIPPGKFDAGRAFATAELGTPPTATAKRWITILPA